jgi:hypothetical protein
VIFPLLRVHAVFLLVFVHGLDAGVRAAPFSRFGSARLRSEFTDLFPVSFPDSGLRGLFLFGLRVRGLICVVCSWYPLRVCTGARRQPILARFVSWSSSPCGARALSPKYTAHSIRFMPL